MTRSLDLAARKVAEELHDLADGRPVLRRRDILAMGIPDATMTAMIRRRLLTRMRHGVYVVTELFDSASPVERHHLDVAAAVAAAEEPTWSFGSSASSLLGMPLPFDVPPIVTLTRRRAADERGMRRPSRHGLVLPDVHVVTGPVDEEAALTVSGIPVVEPGLAAVSTATELTSPRWRTALLDAAMWRGASRESLLRLIDAWRHLGHRDELLAALALARPGAQTVLETFSRLRLIEAGVPEPELQVPIHDEDGLIGNVDMYWAGLGVVGEADGAAAGIVTKLHRKPKKPHGG